MNFESVLETAEWLGKDADMIKLKRLKELTDSQKFYVTVWGHYSAGKSRLINNIFDRDILPVQTRETTAVLTYLQYGRHEECALIYEDGSVAYYGLEILKSVFQNTNDFEDVSKIDHIEVYIHDDILKSGLILVDTPGVNTIIQKHQDLAVDAIEQSGRILYVLGNAPSNIDKQFIKQITACGIQISFIRTKCDRFMETEEDAALSLKKEEEEVALFSGSNAEFIPVSNERNNKWFDNIPKVQALLIKISSKIVEEMKEAGRKRMQVYCDEYRDELKAEELYLSDMIKGNTEDISREIGTCEKELKKLEELARSIEDQVEEKVTQAQKLSKKELDGLISRRIEDFVQELEKTESDINVSDEVKRAYDRHLSMTVERIQKLLNSYFEEIVREETENIASCVANASQDFQTPDYAEIRQENSRILELYRSRLLEVKQRIEAIMKEREETGLLRMDMESEFDETVYEEELANLNQMLSEIPSGTALRAADHQDLQPSSVFKTFGQAVDIGLLLLPGDAIFQGIKAAADTTKVAQALHKMGKIGEVILKAGTAAGKNAKVIDRVRDTAYALNTVLGKRRYSTKAEKEKAQELIDKAAKAAGNTFDSYKESKKSGNVLDALSVAYWTEKLGEKFDTPPRMEIDIEEQERRNQLRREITVQQQQLSDERIQRKRELGLLQNKENELRLREQEEEVKKQRIEEEIKKQEKTILKQAQKRATENYKRAYKSYYREVVCSVSNMISEQYFRTASQNITMYIANKNSELMSNIESKKKKINELLEMKKNGNDEIEKKLSGCRTLLKKLGDE